MRRNTVSLINLHQQNDANVSSPKTETLFYRRIEGIKQDTDKKMIGGAQGRREFNSIMRWVWSLGKV